MIVCVHVSTHIHLKEQSITMLSNGNIMLDTVQFYNFRSLFKKALMHQSTISMIYDNRYNETYYLQNVKLCLMEKSISERLNSRL